jgi:hypothetical protein
MVQVGLGAVGRCWTTPDSAGYIELAAGIAQRWDFTHPLFHLRLPGYPLMLAGVFAGGGGHATFVLPFIQHALVAACAVLAALIAFELLGHRGFALLAAIPTIFSLQLAGYAGAVLSEVPYTFLLLLLIWLLLAAWRRGSWRMLVCASMVAGVLTLFKDSGLLLIGGGLVVAVLGFRQRPVRAGLLAVGPALLVLLPFMIHNVRAFDRLRFNCNGPLLGYQRSACVDRLDAPDSAALARVRTLIENAQRDGVVAADATYQDYLATLRAVQHHFDPTATHIFASRDLPRVSALLGEAGRDIARAHPRQLVTGTLHRARHILFTPDLIFQTIGRHDVFVRQRVGAETIGQYFKFDERPDAPPGSFFARSVAALREFSARPWDFATQRITWHELVTALALLGGAVHVLFIRDRGAILIGLIVAYHVLGAAYLGGVEPRYTLPVQPLLGIWMMLPVWVLMRWRAGRPFVAAGPEVSASTGGMV